ncbi:MAG TPA: four helix bundle protein [Candidatus Sericytochromatia bacterium]
MVLKCELDTQLEICYRLGYLSEDSYQNLDQRLTQIDRMLVGLRQSLLKK